MSLCVGRLRRPASRTRPGPRVGLFLTLLLGSALPGWATSPVTLEQAIQAASRNHERAAIAAQQTRAARAQVGQAWSVLLPSLRLDLGRGEYASAENSLSGSSTYEGWEARAGASQLLFDAQALPLVGAALHSGRAAALDESAERRRLSYEAAAAFLDAYRLRQVARAAGERLSLARLSLDEIRVRSESGLVGSNDLTRAELELANAEREWVQARGAARSGLLRLEALTGTLGTDSLATPEALLSSSAGRPAEQAATKALRLRPDVGAARERAKAARSAAREPLARWVPDLSVSADAWSDESEDFRRAEDHWSWGLNLGWSVFDGGLRLAQLAQRRAEERAARLRAQWLERQVDLNQNLALATLESAQAGLVRAEVALTAARRNSRESGELYRQGLVRALEVTDAAVQLFGAEVERTQAQVNQALAWLDLRAARGLEPLDEGKEQGE